MIYVVGIWIELLFLFNCCSRYSMKTKTTKCEMLMNLNSGTIPDLFCQNCSYIRHVVISKFYIRFTNYFKPKGHPRYVSSYKEKRKSLFKVKKEDNYLINSKSCHLIETTPFISSANQLTSFYIMATLACSELSNTKITGQCLLAYYFMSMFLFYSPWKHQKTFSFLTFSRGIDVKYWLVGWIRSYLVQRCI